MSETNDQPLAALPPRSEGTTPAPATPTSWQPIETYKASFDPVLVCDADGYVVQAYYGSDRDVWWEWNSVDDGAPGSDRRVYPTHWMPLPKPPSPARSPGAVPETRPQGPQGGE